MCESVSIELDEERSIASLSDEVILHSTGRDSAVEFNLVQERD